MNNWHILYRMASQRHQEDLSKAEIYRLLDNRRDGKNQSVRVRWYYRLLDRMGGTMVKWGFWFQSRYQLVDPKKSTTGPALRNSGPGCTIEGPTRC